VLGVVLRPPIGDQNRLPEDLLELVDGNDEFELFRESVRVGHGGEYRHAEVEPPGALSAAKRRSPRLTPQG
jgi:hypothetical protein